MRTNRMSHLASAVLAVSGFIIAGCSEKAAVYEGEPGVVNVRRVTETQYRNTIADVFNDNIEIRGRFEPEMREEGLLAIGSAKLSVTPSGFEQYFSMGADVANAVVSEENRSDLMPCEPTAADASDEACARMALADWGQSLLRRPLSEGELEAVLQVANNVADQSNNFYAGLSQGLTSLLVSPDFLFRIETAEAVPGKSGKVRLDGYSKAARLSYFFWDTTPDDELLSLAASGDIHKPKVLKAQIERLATSERAEHGARAFFSDMLHYDKFATLTKDPQIYPKFSLAVAESAKEQTLRTMVHHLITAERDYRDIFTTRDTFLDRTLAAVYQVPYLGDGDWVAYEIPEDANREGVLTQVSFLSAFSHPGRSSPTLRGVAVNEIYLCEATPLPPANVDFSIVNDVSNTELRTVRQRLMAHSLDDSCSNCHDLSDPVGLTLEHFDSIGQFRTMENGEVIDVSAEIKGMQVEGAAGLADALKASEQVPSCIVQNLYAYGVGRAVEPSDNEFLNQQTKAFSKNGYRYPALLKSIAASEEFFHFEPLSPGALQSAAQHQSQGPMGGQK